MVGMYPLEITTWTQRGKVTCRGKWENEEGEPRAVFSPMSHVFCLTALWQWLGLTGASETSDQQCGIQHDLQVFSLPEKPDFTFSHFTLGSKDLI